MKGEKNEKEEGCKIKMTQKVWVIVDMDHCDIDVFSGKYTKGEVYKKLMKMWDCDLHEVKQTFEDCFIIQKRTIKM